MLNEIRRQTQRVARLAVDAVMGNGLAQHEGDKQAVVANDVTPHTAELARQAAAEGCVLLANDGTLPLSATEQIAVFGRCQFDWFDMGRGSGGDVHPPRSVNLVDGLDEAGIPYNEVLSLVYRDWCQSSANEAEQGWWGHWPTHHPEMPLSLELVRAAARTARTALVVIGRCAGEDQDLPLEEGGYYLAEDERTMIETVVAHFSQVVVIVNATNAIDLSWIDIPACRPSALLLAWPGGMESGHGVVDVLTGRVNPSGRLACTIARSYTDYPSSATFGTQGDVDYTEGVFVGYRHFDTFAPEAVLFPFGHGLSYTDFKVRPGTATRSGATTRVRVSVTNTGTCAGRDAVLLWCELPAGSLPKPKRVLVAFAKTEELAPEESQDLLLRFDLKDIASYDEQEQAFVVEAGSYRLVANGTGVGRFEFDTSHVIERCQRICLPPDELRERILAGIPDPLPEPHDAPLRFADVVRDPELVDRFVAQLGEEELIALTQGEGGMNSALGVAGNAGALGGVTPALYELGVPAAICADGPSGARLQRHCSLVPCASALASTWDVELVERLFSSVGQEVRAAGVDVLLAPGMNIQRNPRCGRNFEYFSEDPAATGRMAAAVVRGLQSAGVSACPKHFACNNQETKRATSNSQVSERTLREIYLRGFEICVRESAPDVVMTSYNKVNGVWAHYHYDLVTTVLRGEWGYNGVVITDWWMRPARSPEFPQLRDNAYRIRAGVDVLMPGSMSHVVPIFPRPRGITRAELERTARRVIALLVRQAAYREG